MEQITAAICTYDRYDVLEKAIESLCQQTLDSNQYKIIIVDNSPDHQKAKAFGRTFKKNHQIDYLIEKKVGLSNARNVAFQNCSSEYITYIDDDAIAKEDYLEKILFAFNKHKANIVGGRVDPIWSRERPPWLGDDLLGHVSVVNWGGKLRIAQAEEWFAGTNVAFSVESLKETGGFSTNLGRKGNGKILLSNEESELINSIKEKDGVIVYQPEAIVDHLVVEDRLNRKWFRKRMAWQATSDFLMNPDQCISQSKSHWEKIIEYSSNVPPRERSLKSLMLETDSSELFYEQLCAIYSWTVLNLAGFEGLSN